MYDCTVLECTSVLQVGIKVLDQLTYVFTCVLTYLFTYLLAYLPTYLLICVLQAGGKVLEKNQLLKITPEAEEAVRQELEQLQVQVKADPVKAADNWR